MRFNQAEFVTSYGLSSQLPQTGDMEVAFAGRSNVGKSSIMNKIFNRKALARVSAVPGKTATINYYRVDHVNFVDLPGYGYAKIAKSEKERWSQLIEKYFTDNRNLMLVVSLIDMRHPPSKLDIDMINYLVEYEFPFIVVLTKSDKLNKKQIQERLTAIKTELPFADELTILHCSASTGDGIEGLKKIIEDVCAIQDNEEE